MKNSDGKRMALCIALLSITVFACGGGTDDGPPSTYSISLAIVGDGDFEISPEKTEYEEGEQVTITATPGSIVPDTFFFQYRGTYTSTENPLRITVDRDIELTAVFKEDRVVNFPDGNLESVIRDELDIPSGDIYLHNVIFVEQINNQYSSVYNLSGIEDFELLSILRISGSGRLADLTPLSGLTNLTFLDLYGNDISDITPLHNLINLELLDIGANYMVIDFDTPNGNGETVRNLLNNGCDDLRYTNHNTVIGTP